ncbi:MAG: RNA polymerase sigma factor [Carbonactinosporaceae bacterium]
MSEDEVGPESSSEVLVRAASAGDEKAWDVLVDRYAGLVWSVVRGYRLRADDAADASQTTWLRLAEHLDRLREPGRVGGWLAATARHECLRMLRSSARVIPDADIEQHRGTQSSVSPEQVVLSRELGTLLCAALQRVSARCQLLLRTLAARPDLTYAELSMVLTIPVGSIGPTRARCIERLRHELAALSGAESRDGGDP